MSAELKPCPMCGSDQIGGVHDKVYCDTCGLTVTKPRPLANAIAAWNRRAAPAQGALTDAEIDAIMAEWARTSNSRMDLCRAIEQRVRGQVSDAADAAPEMTDIDRENLRIGRELQRAAGFLPDDCNIEVNIERGYGSAALFDIDGTCVATFDAADSDGMSYAISKAIDAAIQAQAGDATGEAA